MNTLDEALALTRKAIEAEMIRLDEHTYVFDAKEVQAIRSKYKPGPDANGPYVPDPDKSMVLIGGQWIDIDKSQAELANILSKASEEL